METRYRIVFDTIDAERCGRPYYTYHESFDRDEAGEVFDALKSPGNGINWRNIRQVRLLEFFGDPQNHCCWLLGLFEVKH